MKPILPLLLLCSLLLPLACDRDRPADPSPTVATVDEPSGVDPAAAQPPSPETDEAHADDAVDEADEARRAAAETCFQEETPGARSDCLAEAGVCDDAPHLLRCEFLLAMRDDDARLCDPDRFHGAFEFSRECDFLLVVIGERQRCRDLAQAYEPREDACPIPIPDEPPTTGEEVDQLLVRFLVASAEEAITTGSDCPTILRDKALEQMRRAVELDDSIRDELRASPFTDRLATRVAYHVVTGDFDPETWEGLEEVLVQSPMHAPGITAHVTPTDRLEFRPDGTYHLRRNLRVSPEDPNEFVESEGEWSIQSREVGEVAIIAIDGEEYVFGIADQWSSYFLHPLETIEEQGIAYEYYDEVYDGEAC